MHILECKSLIMIFKKDNERNQFQCLLAFECFQLLLMLPDHIRIKRRLLGQIGIEKDEK